MDLIIFVVYQSSTMPHNILALGENNKKFIFSERKESCHVERTSCQQLEFHNDGGWQQPSW
jgi:hypothetical protein